MDSQGDEFEDEDDFDGIEDVSPSQVVPPSAKRSSTGAGMKESTLADLFSDGEVEEPLATVSARKQGTRSEREYPTPVPLEESANVRYHLPTTHRDPRSNSSSPYPLFIPSLRLIIRDLQE
jgi:hypothetical protein